MTTTKKLIATCFVGAAITASVALGLGLASAAPSERVPPTPYVQTQTPRTPEEVDASLRAQLDHELQTGWTQVGIGEGKSGFIRTSVMTDRSYQLQPGEATPIFDEQLEIVGYWANPLGFIEAPVAEGGALDWVEATHAQPHGDALLAAFYPPRGDVPQEVNRILRIRWDAA